MAGCCDYVPKFPTWNLSIKVWKFNFLLAHHVREMPDIIGQIQQQQQNAAVESSATAYMRYPKTSDRLRDMWDYGDPDGAAYDAVSFPLPSGREVFYRVKEVQGMGIGFTNAHMVATLEKLTASESVAVQPPYEPPPEEPPGGFLLSFTASPALLEADGIAESTGELILLFADYSPAAGIAVTFGTTGSAATVSSDTVTDINGIASIVATNSVEETTHFTASFAGNPSINSNDVIWSNESPPPPDAPEYVSFGIIPNLGCESCDQVSGDHYLTEFTSPSSWKSPSFAWTCSGQTHSWEAVILPDGDRWIMRLSPQPATGNVTYESNPADGFDLPITCYLTESNGYCDWPATCVIA